MPITFRNYAPRPFFTDDYLKVRDFLARVNSGRLVSPNFTWGRWEWMITHSELDHSHLGGIGIWEDGGKMVALATYETVFGEAYFCLDERFPGLKPDMVAYAKKFMRKDGKLRIILPDGDREFQRAAAARGFRPTQNKECLAALDINPSLSYSLPEGFSIVSMAGGWDWHLYDRVMWGGFRQGPPPQTDADIARRKQMLSSPAINPDLVLAVAAPDGRYASHCGMWYQPGDFYAYVEPVATDPDFRKMGLGRAAVLEGAIRCGKLGAAQALVGSSQQFYYNIGFHPVHTETWWELKA